MEVQSIDYDSKRASESRNIDWSEVNLSAKLFLERYVKILHIFFLGKQ